MTDEKLPADVERRFNERYSWNHDRVPYYILEDDAKEFLAQELAQAVAEERERIVGEINNTPIDTAHTYSSENADEYRTFDNGQKSYKQKLLASLDKPVTKKD